MTTSICEAPDPGPPEEGDGFAGRVAAWEAELAEDRAVARWRAGEDAAELAELLAADPALAVAMGLAPDSDRLAGLHGDDGGDPDSGEDEASRDNEPSHDDDGPTGDIAESGGHGSADPVPNALVSDYALVARIAELEQQVARSQAVQVAAMVELAHRSVFRRQDRPGTPAALRARMDTFEDRCHRAALEISAALTVAPQTAANRLSVAVELVRDLPATLSALRDGWLSLRLATLICDETRVLQPTARAMVEAQALAAAPRCTPGQLERNLRAWVITADPKGAAERDAAARRHRNFRVTPLPDGMAQLKAVLTADGAQTVAATVDAVAAGMRHDPDQPVDDERTIDQRRADALVTICADVLDAGHTGCAAQPCGEACSQPDTNATNPTDPARTSGQASGGSGVAGAGGDAGASEGSGASGASEDAGPARAHGAGGTAGNEVSGDAENHRPAARRSGRGGDSPAPGGPANDPDNGPDGADPGGGPDGDDHDVNTEGDQPSAGPAGGAPPWPRARRRLARWHGHRPHIQVTVAVTTLLGIDDLPAQLAGYGPITADQARRIAADGTWRRLLTDPEDGRLLEYGRRFRDPPQDLTDFVLARDVTDRFPTSLTPAHRCDLDHARPWEDDGTTGPDNLNAVSPRAHQTRHATGWTIERLDDGTLEWTSATGHTYRTPPEPVGPLPGDRLLRTLTGTVIDAGQHDDETPPF